MNLGERRLELVSEGEFEISKLQAEIKVEETVHGGRRGRVDGIADTGWVNRQGYVREVHKL